MKNKITKYYIGLGVIGIITVVLVIYTISLGATGKQDANTDKKAQEVATKLNVYINKNQKIPASLNEVGVSDAPKAIAYTKNSDGTTYKFCVTYKSASGTEMDLTGLVWGSAVQGAAQQDASNPYDDSSYKPSTLYVSTYHKKGENCQTIQPYLYTGTRYFNFQNLDSSSGSSATTSASNTAKDTERKTDLKALASHLEVYNAQNGYYPTSANMSSTTWIATNLKGLDKEAMRDPDGTTYVLVSSPATKYYSYQPKAKDGLSCDNTANYPCASFVLTATLSDGTKYTVNSLSN